MNYGTAEAMPNKDSEIIAQAAMPRSTNIPRGECQLEQRTCILMNSF
jgi:hypothetical protein